LAIGVAGLKSPALPKRVSSLFPRHARLEKHLRTELDFSCGSGSKNFHVVGDTLASARSPSEVRETALRASTRRRKVHAIEEIERLESELQRLRFRELKLL
jgi:hypothetical protein